MHVTLEPKNGPRTFRSTSRPGLFVCSPSGWSLSPLGRPWCCRAGAALQGVNKKPYMTYIYIIIYIYIYIIIYLYIYMCASQIIRVGTRSGTTPVPCPPFHTCLKDPFHTSVPYLWSIRYYIYIDDWVYIYIFEHVQSDFTFVRTYMSAHTYMSAYMQEYVYYAQALWLCWQVCACSTYSCYLLCCVMVGMCLAAASCQSKNGCACTT